MHICRYRMSTRGANSDPGQETPLNFHSVESHIIDINGGDRCMHKHYIRHLSQQFNVILCSENAPGCPNISIQHIICCPLWYTDVHRGLVCVYLQ